MGFFKKTKQAEDDLKSAEGNLVEKQNNHSASAKDLTDAQNDYDDKKRKRDQAVEDEKNFLWAIGVILGILVSMIALLKHFGVIAWIKSFFIG